MWAYVQYIRAGVECIVIAAVQTVLSRNESEASIFKAKTEARAGNL